MVETPSATVTFARPAYVPVNGTILALLAVPAERRPGADGGHGEQRHHARDTILPQGDSLRRCAVCEIARKSCATATSRSRRVGPRDRPFPHARHGRFWLREAHRRMSPMELRGITPSARGFHAGDRWEPGDARTRLGAASAAQRSAAASGLAQLAGGGRDDARASLEIEGRRRERRILEQLDRVAALAHEELRRRRCRSSAPA